MKVLLMALFLVLLLSCTQNSQEEEYITIGALLPLTGESSDEGLRALNGLHLAREEINSNGGILGKKLDIYVLNDHGDEVYILEQYEKLMERGVTAIIGSSYSTPTIELAKASERDGIPVISPTASNPVVTLGRRNVFRAIFIDNYQAEAMAYFAYNHLDARTALIITNLNFDTYVNASEVFAESFRSYGGEIIAMESYYDDDILTYLLEKHESNPPDVIFYPEDFIPAARLVNMVHEMGLRDSRLLGSDAWDGLLAYVYNPEVMERAYYSAPFSFDDDAPEVMLFVRNFFTAFSQMPLAGSATAYNCMYILARAMEIAESTEWDAIIDAMKTNTFELMTGSIEFDEDNNPYTSVYVIQIKGGVYSTRIKISLGRR